MSIPLLFLSAVVRKSDIDSHYPGGCVAFESQYLLAREDDDLYAIVSMSGLELEERLAKIKSDGFDTDRFMAIGDMWLGSLKEVSGIRFYTGQPDTMLPTWHAECEGKAADD